MTTRAAAPRPRIAGSGVVGRPRGVALILAMLVMIALLGLSFVAAERTITEVSTTGAYRLLTTAEYVAEGGHKLTVSQVALTPGVILATNYQMDDVFFGGTFYATPAGKGPGIDPETFGLESYAGAVAGFTSRFVDPESTNRVPGFSSDTFVFTKYTVETTGFYQVGQPALGDAFTRRAQSTVAGQIFVLSGTTGGGG